MAIAKMTKVRLIGLKKDNQKTLDLLTEYGMFHQESTVCSELSFDDNSEKLEHMLALRGKLAFAIDYLKKQNAFVAGAKKKKQPIAQSYSQPVKIQNYSEPLACNEVTSVLGHEKEIIAVVDELEKISFESGNIAAELQSLKEIRNGYMRYSELPIAFSVMRDTQSASIIIASNPSKKACFDTEGLNVIVEEYGLSPKIICAVCLKADKKDVLERLGDCGFSLCPYSDDVTAKEKITEVDARQQELTLRQTQLINRTIELTEYDFRLKLLYDCYSLKSEQLSVDNTSGKSEYTFVLDGWTPAEKAEDFVKRVNDELPDVFVELSEADKDDLPPTCTQNNAFVKPFENITLMYTVPNYHEKDPNPIMSFWFFFLFGIMTGDVVYGIVLTLACLLIPKFVKLNSGVKNFIKMFFWCGISSTVWGLLFGSFAGLSVPVSKSLPFITYSTQADGVIKNYLGWFNPMEKPVMLLGLSLIVGILQLLCGYMLKFFALLRERRVIDALCDAILPSLFLISIVLIGADIFAGVFDKGEIIFGGGTLPEKLGGILKNIGMYTLIAALVLIFFTGGRKSKSVGGYLGGGLNGLYGLINLIADILSYARLFGLGLAGAAIAFAFNTLVETIFFKNVIMIIIGIGISLILHLFNFAISLLGTYVHNSRLQLLEFYGKFLVGDGKMFKPMGHKTKYVEIAGK